MLLVKSGEIGSRKNEEAGSKPTMPSCGWASLVVQSVKNLPAVLETWVWSLEKDDPLEKEMANHSSILAWKIPWTEEPGRLQSMGLQESDMTK